MQGWIKGEYFIMGRGTIDLLAGLAQQIRPILDRLR
jgi:hypothetical protein